MVLFRPPLLFPPPGEGGLLALLLPEAEAGAPEAEAAVASGAVGDGVGEDVAEEPGLGVAESVPVLLPVLLGVVLGVREGEGSRYTSHFQ